MKILEAVPEDAKFLVNVQTQAWVCAYPNRELGITKKDIKDKAEEFNSQGAERVIKEILKPGAKTWIAKADDKVVGFIGVLKTADESKIMALHILPEFQGKGIGTKLLNTALDWLGNSKKITIEVVIYNNQAIEFYKKFGFKNTGEIVEDKIRLPGGKLIEKVLMEKTK